MSIDVEALNTCKVYSQAVKYGNRSDYSKVKINIRNTAGFNSEREIQKCIGDALVSFSSYFKHKSSEMFTNKVNYDPLSQKILNCTLIVVLPCPISILKFDHFIARFLSKLDFETNNG